MSDVSLLPVGSGMGSDALAAAGGALSEAGGRNPANLRIYSAGSSNALVLEPQGLLYGCKWVSYWIGEQLEYFKVSVKIDKYRRYEIMLL